MKEPDVVAKVVPTVRDVETGIRGRGMGAMVHPLAPRKEPAPRPVCRGKHVIADDGSIVHKPCITKLAQWNTSDQCDTCRRNDVPMSQRPK